ncbi:MAG: hypothetical protein GPJ54_20815 [Candidatus Heimdallarchaeota archaeon]|nr:hypothetical protein [Candidatus Heimdallarchaeota archaeon]
MDKIGSFKLEPTFRENATLYVGSEDEKNYYSGESAVLVYHSNPAKKYSFAVAVDEIIIDVNNPSILKVNKNLVGPLVEADSVKIVPFGIQDAEKVIFLLSDSLRVPEGDWSDLLKDQFNGQVIDEGSECVITYPSSLNPVMTSAVVEATIPSAPARLTKNTRVFVKKRDEMSLAEFNLNSQKNKAQRVGEYLEQLKEETFGLIREIKNDKARSASDRFDFRADPQKICEGVKVIFQGWNSLKSSETQSEGGFVAGMDYVLKSQNQVLALTEVKVFAKGDEGKLDIITYTQSTSNPRNYLDELEKNIHSLTLGISTSPKIVTENCPNCGSSYDPRDADSDGIITCESCSTVIGNDLQFMKYRIQ